MRRPGPIEFCIAFRQSARHRRAGKCLWFGLEQAMGWILETLGDTAMLLSRDGVPILAADPWLSGSACFGSWARERDLAPGSIKSLLRAPYAFLSRGSDGRLHLPSLKAMGRGCDILLPGNFDAQHSRMLEAEGFATRILPHKQWVEIVAGLRLMCVESEYGAILALDADGLLILNKNDSPFCGEERFFRKLTRAHARSYLLALPETAFPGEKSAAVRDLGRACDLLGVTHYAASEPHIHRREDSRWADAGRVSWADVARHWKSAAKPIEPYAKIALAIPAMISSPAFVASSAEAALSGTCDDDWSELLSAADWFTLDCFVKGATPFRRGLDFVAFNVGGELRRIPLRARAARKPLAKQRGLVFAAPRKSLIESVTQRRFGELLDAGFVRLELVNLESYPLGGFRRAAVSGAGASPASRLIPAWGQILRRAGHAAPSYRIGAASR